MQIKGLSLLFLFLLAFNISFAYAEYSLDIKIPYEIAVGEDLKFNVLLLENNSAIPQKVIIIFSDALGKNKIEKEVITNTENVLYIEENFSAGFWNAVAEFEGKKASRIFSIKEKESVDFSIKEDKLIIKNNGNVAYSKEIQIMIGDEVVKQRLNIGVGNSKEIRLLGKNNYYDVKVTDGEQTIAKQGIYLTGDVIGALDENLVDGSPIGGVREPGEEGFFSSSRLPIAFIFVGAVFGLGILLLIEKRLKKR